MTPALAVRHPALARSPHRPASRAIRLVEVEPFDDEAFAEEFPEDFTEDDAALLPGGLGDIHNLREGDEG